jgi:hypothetical protein
MEKAPQLKDPDISSIEAQADFEGNDSELLFERVKDSVIKAQIIDMLCQDDMVEAERIRNLKFTSFDDPDRPQMRCFKDQDGMIYMSKNPDYDPKNYEPRTREQIEIDLAEAIEQTAGKTSIDLSEDQPDSECIPLNWKMTWNSEKPTVKQMSIIEAHEKGHAIRTYDRLRGHFARGFDTTKMEYGDKDFEMDVLMRKKDDSGTKDFSRENMRAETIRYLFSGTEIAERMSQLKNYFGMKGSKKFTSEHLHYARDHYIVDTGMDNRMKQFFQAVTPETEGAFLELINSSGI